MLSAGAEAVRRLCLARHEIEYVNRSYRFLKQPGRIRSGGGDWQRKGGGADGLHGQ